ncbi:MAG: NAD(P)/FAD-dependent oxidoreductase [Cyclobacteriaceae bacterium]|nr:NAD(P)/FAD-dependent oxidoreductase [Cyclobacteriaceae bacterium]
MQKNVAIVGGGLAGLTAAICLSRQGISCTVFEKRKYPFHRVCGEYVSNEAKPFLQSLGVFPAHLEPPSIHRFQLSAVNGKYVFLNLDLGGFGISRFAFDNFLAEKARESDVKILENCEVREINYHDGEFELITSTGTFTAGIVIGAYGKRSKLDFFLNRDFIKKRSPFVGVKYHIRTDFPDDLIALHNFPGGYCGISRVENGLTNLCYLVHRDVLRQSGNIAAMEGEVLCRNPLLEQIFKHSEFLFQQPETINEISFDIREPVYNHILMAGDTAGLIAPLCGNGMAMAIHAGKMVSELIHRYCKEKKSRAWLENEYARQWRALFVRRLRAGRLMQHYLFGSAVSSGIAVNLALTLPPVARQLVRLSHGKVF